MARILIADDQPDLRLALVAVVEADGHEAIEAGDGAEAVAKVRAHRPDVVLMDGHMVGVNGFDALRCLKQTADTCDVPVIMVTAFGETRTRVEAMELGAHGYVTKPWGNGELEWSIRQVLTASACGGSHPGTGGRRQ
jgi:DNA-binding response OmpR family regulator